MSIPPIHPTAFPGVFTDDEKLYTLNSAPGHAVYGERRVISAGEEYREWSVTRSKLAAYLHNGGRHFPFREDTNVLYLGAASGTTASHVADIVHQGTVYCVEFSPRSFRDLVKVCENRPNMVPLLADATRPSEFAFGVEGVTVVYQDVAQKGQALILAKNMKAFSSPTGMLVVKSRSEDVTRSPHEVYNMVRGQLREEGIRVLETIPLDPMEKDHAMMAVERI
ncbi:MAG: fibrillarin-like rRNA/tRNA 2'-O-methyltransferase [Euryarchaeota archaeon]|nr:fibrillarin-like rRNA/tRNA 2'-O-methyltransferase [Euryarchaeota archaeon]